jgi:hypothetical protein
MTRPGLLGTSDSDPIECIPCEELMALASDEKVMKELYAQSEVLQTATQPKRLVVYKEYLLWFRDMHVTEDLRTADPSSSPQKGNQAADATRSCSTSKAGSQNKQVPMLEGYANIRGMYVESNHSTKIHNDPQDDLGLGNALSSLKTAQEYLILKKEIKLGQEEILSFADKCQLERWRELLSQALVIFTDLGEHFEQVGTLSTDANCIMGELKRISDGRMFSAEHHKLHKHMSFEDKSRFKAKVVAKCQIIRSLRGMQVCAGFVELHQINQGFIVVTEYQQGQRLDLWAREYWLRRIIPGEQDTKTTITMMRDLLILVMKMHANGMTHGNLGAAHITAIKRGNRQSENQVNTQPIQGGSVELRSWVKSVESITNNDVVWEFQLLHFMQATQHLLADASQPVHPTMPDLRTSPQSDPYKTLLLHMAHDVYQLGFVFYLLVYALDIENHINRQNTVDSDFIQRLIDKPQEYIALKEQHHFVGNTAENLIASMLLPDWQQRPTTYEVFQTLQSLLDEPNQGLGDPKCHASKLRNNSVVLDQDPNQIGIATLLLDPANSKLTNSPFKRFTTVQLASASKLPRGASGSRSTLIQPVQINSGVENAYVKQTTTKPKIHNLESKTSVTSSTRPRIYLKKNPERSSESITGKSSPTFKCKKQIYFNFHDVSSIQRMSEELKQRNSQACQKSRYQLNESSQGCSEGCSPVKYKNVQPEILSSSSEPKRGVPLVMFSGRTLFSPQNKLKRVVLPAGESIIGNAQSIDEFNERTSQNALAAKSRISGNSLLLQQTARRSCLRIQSPINYKRMHQQANSIDKIDLSLVDCPALTLRILDIASNQMNPKSQVSEITRQVVENGVTLNVNVQLNVFFPKKQKKAKDNPN